jgi:glycosyltransferase involved in cell wall biosynthesis
LPHFEEEITMSFTPPGTGYIIPKISAFTLIKNAVRFDYPIVESVKSLLPMVDEYIINIGDSADGTREMVHAAFDGDTKVKMFDSIWEDPKSGTSFFSNQTNKSLEQCSGDWAFYLQADEAVHEKDHADIFKALLDAQAAGKKYIVFDYLHFEKNFSKLRKTYSEGFDCYEDEVRLFRNDKTVMSWGDAQGFCRRDGYGLSLRKLESDLYIPHINIYHYGYVKSPKAMLDKKKALNEFYFNEAHFSEEQKQKELDKIKNAKDEYEFSFQLNDFNGTHPAPMLERIAKFNHDYPYLLED